MSSKEDILENLNHVEFLINVEKTSLQMEKDFRRSCRNFIIANVILLVVYTTIKLYSGKAVDFFDVVIISIIVSSTNHQISSLASSDSNIKKHEHRLSRYKESLKNLERKLYDCNKK